MLLRAVDDDAVTLREVQGAAARAFLRERWPDLYRHDPRASAWQSPAWVAGWCESLPADAEPCVLVAEGPQGEELAALALVRALDDRHRTTVRPLSSPVTESVQAVGPASDAPPVALALAQGLHLLSRGSDVVLSDVPLAGALGLRMAAQPGWQHSITQCASVRLPLDLTKRQHRRRAQEWTALTESVGYRRSRTDEELLADWRTLTLLHERQWTNPQYGPEEERQLQEVVPLLGSGTAFVASLTLGGRVVAAQLCLYRDGRAHSLRPAMDLGLPRRLAPGHALLRHLAHDLHESGFFELDLGRTVRDPGQIDYKQQYQPRTRWTATVTASVEARDGERQDVPSSGVRIPGARQHMATAGVWAGRSERREDRG